MTRPKYLSAPNLIKYKIENKVYDNIKDIAEKYNLSKETAYKYIVKRSMPNGTVINKIIIPRY